MKDLGRWSGSVGRSRVYFSQGSDQLDHPALHDVARGGWPLANGQPIHDACTAVEAVDLSTYRWVRILPLPGAAQLRAKFWHPDLKSERVLLQVSDGSKRT